MYPIIFILWLVFFDWTELACSLCWFTVHWAPQIFTFFAYGIFMIATKKNLDWQFDFYNSDKPSLLPTQEDIGQAIFILLHKQKFYCLNFKCFCKALVKCWFFQNTAVYLSTSWKSLQISRVFTIFMKLCARQMNV